MKFWWAMNDQISPFFNNCLILSWSSIQETVHGTILQNQFQFSINIYTYPAFFCRNSVRWHKPNLPKSFALWIIFPKSCYFRLSPLQRHNSGALKLPFFSRRVFSFLPSFRSTFSARKQNGKWDHFWSGWLVFGSLFSRISRFSAFSLLILSSRLMMSSHFYLSIYPPP